jgi:hypothetical protein
VVSRPQILDGEPAQASAQQSRPTLVPGGHGPVPMPVQREELPAPRTYAQNMKATENDTGNPRARNPNSTAMGDGQFIESTWLDLMKRTSPGLVQGKSDAEILEMRGDPAISREMTNQYAEQNRAFLKKNGIENPGDDLLAAAHKYGPQATLAFAKASPDTPMTAILSPEAIKANPQLAGITVGQARANLQRRFAGAQAPGQQPQQTAEAPQEQSAGDEGFSRVRNLKALGLPDAPNGMQWIGRRRADGSIETKVAPIPGANVEKPQTNADIAKVEREWRTDFSKPVTQARELTSQLGIIHSATAKDDGTGDIAAITGFNKLLDPGAVVREADVALTLKAQGLGEQLELWMANKQKGDVLSPELRTRIRELSDEIYATSNGYLRDGVMTYREAIEHGGGNFDRVLPPQMRKSLGWEIDPNAPKPERPKPKEEKKPAEVAAAPPALEGRTVGQTYQTPRGPAIWRGNGWELTK